MSWLWSSSKSVNGSSKDPSDASHPTTQPVPSNAPADSTPRTPIPLSREQQADKELESFLVSLESSTYSTDSNGQDHDRISSQFSSSSTTTSSNPPASPGRDPNDISPRSLYPRTMSCRQAFDQAFYCQSLGGKFNDIYRFGHLQSCSENWEAFWFCMRTKQYPDHEKQVKIAEYYEAREQRKMAEKGSSEAVWGLRTKPVEKAFWRDPDAVQEDVAQ